MADNRSKEVRSYNMAKVRSKDTKPELIVRKFLFSKGFRYRLHDKKLPGKPDIILTKYKTIIFIHGCFWHGHNYCQKATIPKTRTEWWTNKIEKNKINDKTAIAELSKLNWRVIILWTCELKGNWQDQLIALLS